jgi:DNA-binding transcriptional MerR regulator
MRIGELSRRTGVSPELLRAWEQRYGLLHPSRSPGGFRLYSSDDELRVRRTLALIQDGLSAAEAAKAAGSEPAAEALQATPTSPGQQTSGLTESIGEELRQALEAYDAAAAHRAMDRLLSTFSARFAITEVLIPYLRDVGERWADGRITVAQEHFASHLVRGRMLSLAGDWGSGGPATAVLACLPGEAHDLGLTFFGVLLSHHGWRVTFLGADTPLDTVETSVAALRPTAVVLATIDADRFHQHTDAIRRLAVSTTVAVAAPVEAQDIEQLGAQALVAGIAESADRLAEDATRPAPGRPSRRARSSAAR